MKNNILQNLKKDLKKRRKEVRKIRFVKKKNLKFKDFIEDFEIKDEKINFILFDFVVSSEKLLYPIQDVIKLMNEKFKC